MRPSTLPLSEVTQRGAGASRLGLASIVPDRVDVSGDHGAGPRCRFLSSKNNQLRQSAQEGQCSRRGATPRCAAHGRGGRTAALLPTCREKDWRRRQARRARRQPAADALRQPRRSVSLPHGFLLFLLRLNLKLIVSSVINTCCPGQLLKQLMMTGGPTPLARPRDGRDRCRTMDPASCCSRLRRRAAG